MPRPLHPSACYIIGIQHFGSRAAANTAASRQGGCNSLVTGDAPARAAKSHSSEVAAGKGFSPAARRRTEAPSFTLQPNGAGNSNSTYLNPHVNNRHC